MCWPHDPLKAQLDNTIRNHLEIEAKRHRQKSDTYKKIHVKDNKIYTLGTAYCLETFLVNSKGFPASIESPC